MASVGGVLMGTGYCSNRRGVVALANFLLLVACCLALSQSAARAQQLSDEQSLRGLSEDLKKLGESISKLEAKAPSRLEQFQQQLGAPKPDEREAFLATLGHKLFFDPRLSKFGNVSCSTCHDPKFGWSNGRPRGEGGTVGSIGEMNVPTSIFAAHQPRFFYNQRVATIRRQCLEPLVNPIEMANDSMRQVEENLRVRAPGYFPLFQRAFAPGTRTITAIATCLEAFQRTIVTPFDAPIDLFIAGKQDALSDQEKFGFALFKEFRCIECHQYPLFRDDLRHNNGSPFRFVTGRSGQLALVKTPTLREIKYTAPYFSTGAAKTLYDVVEHYNVGGFALNQNGQQVRASNIDRRIRPLGMQQVHKDALVAFLMSISSPHYPKYETPALP